MQKEFINIEIYITDKDINSFVFDVPSEINDYKNSSVKSNHTIIVKERSFRDNFHNTAL